MLRPAEHVHKLLLSSPCRFVGEYQSEDLLLTLAWLGFWGRDKVGEFSQFSEYPYSRNYFTLAVNLKEEPSAGGARALPNYSPLGDAVCAVLGVLFGKRFDNHGFLETHGQFTGPEITGVRPTPYFQFGPYNHRPRADLGIELNLTH